MKLTGLVTLAIAVGATPPAEFRIFRAGLNSSRKGPVLFDAVAARQVMSAYAQHGADLMIDLNHLSLDSDSPNYDADARGWCRLAVRDGELWAVQVRWTVDGRARLISKRQRYISPAFRRDTKTARPLFLHNIAITATPATDHPEPLVAASDRGTPMLNAEFLALLGLPPDADADAVAKAIAADPETTIAAISAEFDEEAGEQPADADPAEVTEADECKPAPAAPAPAPAPAAGAAKAPPGKVKKVTTEYHPMSAVAAEMAKELVALRAESNDRRVRDIIRENREKFTPALEKWALTQAPDVLEAFVASAPRLADPKRHKEPPASASSDVVLSAEEKKLCRLNGTDPAKLLAHKLELAKRQAEKDEA